MSRMLASRLAMKPRTWPTLGRKISPRGSFGFGSMATFIP
jgi:hypothetical protein